MRVAPSIDVSTTSINVILEDFKNEFSSRLKKYSLKAAVFISYLVSVVAGYIVMGNNHNIKMAEQDYFIYVTPKRLFFKIWIVIYILIFLAICHNLWRDVWKTKSSLLLFLSNMLMILHIGIWSIRSVASIVIGGLVLACCDDVTIWFWRVLIDEHNESSEVSQNIQQSEVTQAQDQLSITITNQNESPTDGIVKKEKKQNRYKKWQLLIVRNIFSLYIGWITVAGTIMTGLMVVFWWGFTLCQQFIMFWITTPIAATAIYLFLATKQRDQAKYCIGYLVAVIWGIIGATIASFQNIANRGQC